MSIRIIADSGCDILPAEAEKMGITILPLKVSFEGEEYLDGATLSHEDFYLKLIESDTLPKTSQASPYEYEEFFEESVKANDEVICITISSKLSGCYQSANISASDYEHVYLVDSENACAGERILVEYAVRLRDQGVSCREIIALLEEKKKHIRILGLLDTLEYLKKGGRISSVTAAAGELLSIKPVVTIEEGIISVVGKARGSKNGNNLLNKIVEKDGGIDFTMPYCVSYTGLSDALIQKYLSDSSSIYESMANSIPIHTVGCAIGTHIGPGGIAVAYFKK